MVPSALQMVLANRANPYIPNKNERDTNSSLSSGGFGLHSHYIS